jgi:quercetin dioxygenase-like cupin family protein
VTGVDGQGRSRIEIDQPLAIDASDNQRHRSDFWLVRHLPVPLNGPLEPTADWKAGTQAPTGGAFASMFSWPAGTVYPRHMTPTLDVIIVISGSLELVLDTESRMLTPGDVVIQRGTAHGWRVPGPEPCTFAGVGLDAAVSR